MSAISGAMPGLNSVSSGDTVTARGGGEAETS